MHFTLELMTIVAKLVLLCDWFSQTLPIHISTSVFPNFQMILTCLQEYTCSNTDTYM